MRLRWWWVCQNTAQAKELIQRKKAIDMIEKWIKMAVIEVEIIEIETETIERKIEIRKTRDGMDDTDRDGEDDRDG